MRLILFQDPLMVTLNQVITMFKTVEMPTLPHLNAVIVTALFLWIVGMIGRWHAVKATQPEPATRTTTSLCLLVAISVMIGLLSGDCLLGSV